MPFGADSRESKEPCINWGLGMGTFEGNDDAAFYQITFGHLFRLSAQDAVLLTLRLGARDRQWLLVNTAGDDSCGIRRHVYTVPPCQKSLNEAM